MDEDINFAEVLRLKEELRELIEYEFMSDRVDYYGTALNMIRAGYKKNNAE